MYKKHYAPTDVNQALKFGSGVDGGGGESGCRHVESKILVEG